MHRLLLLSGRPIGDFVFPGLADVIVSGRGVPLAPAVIDTELHPRALHHEPLNTALLLHFPARRVCPPLPVNVEVDKAVRPAGRVGDRDGVARGLDGSAASVTSVGKLQVVVGASCEGAPTLTGARGGSSASTSISSGVNSRDPKG